MDRLLRMLGANADVDAAEDAITAGGTYPWLAAAQTHNIASSSESDEDEKAATGTVTVVDYTKLAATAATPSGTITFGTPSNGSTVIVTGPSGGPYTFTKVAATPGALEFTTIGELEALIEAIPGLNSSENGTVITLVVATAGTAANSWTITGTSSYAALSITFSGGLNNATLTVNGSVLTAGTNWTAATSNDATATSLASAINGLALVGAAAVAAAITVTADTGGTAGNAITLATSDVINLTISGATLSGGSTTGVGANKVTIVGLNSSYDEVSEVVALNGSVAIETTTLFLRINRMYVSEGSVNVGNITATGTVSSTVTRRIAAGDGESRDAVLTIPDGLIATPVILGLGVIAGTGCSARILHRDDGSSPWKVLETIETTGAYAEKRVEHGNRWAFPARSDVRVEFSPSGTNVSAACSLLVSVNRL